jgi:hypothetical protein
MPIRGITERYPYSNASTFEFRTRGYFEKLLRIGGGRSTPGVFWSKYVPRNFGDWITPYLYFHMVGEIPIFQGPSRHFTTVFGAGSIVRRIKVANSAIVWGSGAISRQDEFAAPRSICAVRGPLTREVFRSRGIDCPEVYGDPGILLPRVFQPDRRIARDRVAVIPHFKELPLFATTVLPEEVNVIDVTLPMESVIEALLGCRHAVSSSLHGLIVCHAYGIPCAWVRFSQNWVREIEGDDMKFEDYFLSVGLGEYVRMTHLEPSELPGSDELRGMASAVPMPDMTSLQDQLLAACPLPIPKTS